MADVTLRKPALDFILHPEKQVNLNGQEKMEFLVIAGKYLGTCSTVSKAIYRDYLLGGIVDSEDREGFFAFLNGYVDYAEMSRQYMALCGIDYGRAYIDDVLASSGDRDIMGYYGVTADDIHIIRILAERAGIRLAGSHIDWLRQAIRTVSERFFREDNVAALCVY